MDRSDSPEPVDMMAGKMMKLFRKIYSGTEEQKILGSYTMKDVSLPDEICELEDNFLIGT